MPWLGNRRHIPDAHLVWMDAGVDKSCIGCVAFAVDSVRKSKSRGICVDR